MTSTTPRLALDIRGQSASLVRVMDQHCGVGRARLLEGAGVLRSSDRVVIVGIGASLNATIAFESLLCSHGIRACVIEAGELLHYRLAACRDATIVVVSRSGESIEVARLIEALRGRVPIVGVTNELGSTLGREADVALDVGSLPDEMVAIQSYTGTLLALYLLGMATADRWSEARRELDALLPDLPGWITSNLQARLDWDAFLEPDSCLYALGRGPSYGSAAQGALLFSEVAKAPAVGMAVASFRHGPIEVVDRRFKALVFAPSGRTRELNVGLANDIRRFGGSVRVIGPKVEEWASSAWIDTPPCSEMLAPIVEIVPVQVAAMRFAELRGIEVGRFRFAPQVTTDEIAIAREQGRATDA